MSSDFNFNFCYVRLPVEQNRENTYFMNSSIYSIIHSAHWIDFYSIIRHKDRIVRMGIYSTTAARGMWLITRYKVYQNWRHGSNVMKSAQDDRLLSANDVINVIFKMVPWLIKRVYTIYHLLLWHINAGPLVNSLSYLPWMFMLNFQVDHCNS